MAMTEKSIHLRTEIPGPGSRAIVARREAASPPGAAKLTSIAVASAHGAVVTDVDGNQFLDMAGGIGVLAVGHTPAAVVDALKAQAEKLIHMCAIVATYEPAVTLCERLNALAPGDFPKRTVLMNSGAEAVETAVHISRSYTKRQGIVVFDGSYHGRTNMTMAMTSKFNLFKKGFGPFAPEIYRFPFPNVYRRPDGMSADAWVQYHVNNLEHAFTAIVDPSHVAAVVIEPVIGEGGFLPVPAPFLRRLRELCDTHGIVLVCDEVQSGMGRTGKVWACEHAGVVPDIITTAKSLGAGMPISAIIGRAEIMSAPHPGGLGGTYSGNPLSCVAALAALDEITKPEFLARATAVGEQMRRHLETIQSRHPTVVGDVRGLGPMLAAELVKDPVTKAPWMEATQAVTARALQHGLIVLRAGLFSNCVRLLPPLNISDAQIEEAMHVLGVSFDEAVETLRAQ